MSRHGEIILLWLCAIFAICNISKLCTDWIVSIQACIEESFSRRKFF